MPVIVKGFRGQFRTLMKSSSGVLILFYPPTTGAPSPGTAHTAPGRAPARRRSASTAPHAASALGSPARLRQSGPRT